MLLKTNQFGLFILGKIAKWKKKLHEMKGEKKTLIPSLLIEEEKQQQAATKAAVPVVKRKFAIHQFATEMEKQLNPYWTSRKNSLELIEPSSINTVSLV